MALADHLKTDHLNRAGLRLGLAVLLAGACLTVLGSGAARAGEGVSRTGPTTAVTWSVQPTPKIPDPHGGLSGISCTSQSFCVSAGGPYTAAIWNGTSWRKQRLPGSILPSAVSCTSPAYCAVVGVVEDPYGNTTTEIIAWNGTKWAVQPSPAFAFLNGVSCSSPSACMAVGDTYDPNSQLLPRVERWNGTTWSMVANPKENSSGELDAVSCSSAAACTLTGYTAKARTDTPLIERWNGSSLVLQQAAQPPSVDSSVIEGVSCPGNDACIAVGNVDSRQPYIEIWDGTTWTAMASPAIAGQLFGVSCTAITACTAVGAPIETNAPAVAEQLSGSTWSMEQVPAPGGSSEPRLDGVSCPLATDCMAVGGYTSWSHDDKSLAEQWNGTQWAIQAAPNDPTRPLGSFSGVSCATASDCTAVGGFTSSDYSLVPLGETWNGTGWTISNPRPFSLGAVPAAVSCPAASMCMAVGGHNGGDDGSYPWAAVQNGTTWVTVNPPPPSGIHTIAELTGVSCASATYCIAVGSDYSVSGGQVSQLPLAYAWNGTTWTAMTMPAVTTGYLSGVSCTSATWCVAVGDGSSSWLAEVWDGTAWTVMPTSGSPAIYAVSCSSAVACTAVGDAHVARQATIERWDGVSWTAQRPALSPPGYKYAVLDGVSCALATACTAVGYYWSGESSGTTKSFIQAWDGTGWTAEQSPATGYGDLASVSCTSPTVCTAVGTTKATSIWEKPLAERSG